VQVDEFLHSMALSSRYFLKENREVDGDGETEGDLAGRVTEIKALGSLEMVRKLWDHRGGRMRGRSMGCRGIGRVMCGRLRI
jgi:hypothetical protein